MNGINKSKNFLHMEIIHIDPDNRWQVHQFIQFPFDLYKGNSFWVPPSLVTCMPCSTAGITPFTNIPRQPSSWCNPKGHPGQDRRHQEQQLHPASQPRTGILLLFRFGR